MNGKRLKLSAFLCLGCLALGALILMPGCNGLPDEPPVKPQVYILILDPTVFEPGELEKLRSLTRRLSDYLKAKIPQKSTVSVFIVGDGMVQATEEKYFEPRVEYGGEKKHRAEVESYLRGLAGLFEKKWELAHQEEQVRTATSCILSSLAAVDRNIIVSPKDSEISLMLLSDMVESCDDWGSLISFERGEAEIERLKRVEAGVTLSRLSSVMVVQLPSRFAMSPKEIRSIESFWKVFFVEKAKVPEDRLHYLPNFPVER